MPVARPGTDTVRVSKNASWTTPEEIAATMRYLCSDDARFVTGSMLVLDGGYTAQ